MTHVKSSIPHVKSSMPHVKSSIPHLKKIYKKEINNTRKQAYWHTSEFDFDFKLNDTL